MGCLSFKKVCSFSVSSVHFSVMILPYINQKLEKNQKIFTILEENLDNNIKDILSKITLNKEAKEKIMNVNWKATDIENVNIEKSFAQEFTNDDEISFIIYGGKKYINIVNKIIEKKLDSILKKRDLIIKNIKIINCYKIQDFQENIKEILNEHETILNTSGEKKIEDIYHSA